MQTLEVDRALEHRWNYEFRDPRVSREELIKGDLPKLLVPRNALYGIQTIYEYSTKKRLHLNRDFKGKPIAEIFDILSEHPVHAVAIPHFGSPEVSYVELLDNIPYSLAVIDGHHRIRYSPKSIKSIPTTIFTTKQALRIYHARFRYDHFAFIAQIRAEMAECLHSFTGINPRFEPYNIYFQHLENDSTPDVGLIGKNQRFVPI